MTPLPLLAIACLSRCGSSLTMQMLAAGGVPCAGTFPDFEVDDVDHRPIDAAWLEARRGHAFKLLDPHLTPLPEGAPVVALWLDRDLRQQADSQIKMLEQGLGILSRFGRGDRRRWRASLEKGRKASLWGLGDRVVARFAFELMLAEPAAYAELLGALAWTLLGVEFDRTAAAACVRRREAACTPDLALEAALIAEAEARVRPGQAAEPPIPNAGS